MSKNVPLLIVAKPPKMAWVKKIQLTEELSLGPRARIDRDQKNNSSPMAVIGTAGRSEGDRMTRALWDTMTEYFKELQQEGIVTARHLISGGAAWSDHIAVWAFNQGLVDALTLCLPAPFDREKNTFHQASSYERSAANAANYHQKQFGKIIKEDTLAQIGQSIAKGAVVFEQPHEVSYAPMFRRNAQIAQHATAGVIAFSFDQKEPTSPGTRSTWDQIQAEPKINVNLRTLPKEIG